MSARTLEWMDGLLRRAGIDPGTGEKLHTIDLDRCGCDHIRADHGEDSPFQNACLVDGCDCERFHEREYNVDLEAKEVGR